MALILFQQLFINISRGYFSFHCAIDFASFNKTDSFNSKLFSMHLKIQYARL